MPPPAPPFLRSGPSPAGPPAGAGTRGTAAARSLRGIARRPLRTEVRTPAHALPDLPAKTYRPSTHRPDPPYCTPPHPPDRSAALPAADAVRANTHPVPDV